LESDIWLHLLEWRVNKMAEKELTAPVKLARAAVENFVKTGRATVNYEPFPEMNEKAGVFVCLKIEGQLRGCIGTFEPCCRTVSEEIMMNALATATRDPRFPPVTPKELPHLEYTVDILTSPEPVEAASQLDPKKYGVIVEAGGRKGLLLPDLDGVDTVEDQISICRQKAGISPRASVKLYRFQVKRYV